jgi:uncharacterized membrane protein YeaQ/YmgE (transglycosylase-associated protein family)
MTTVNIIAWAVLGGIVGLIIALLRGRVNLGAMVPELLVGVIGGFLGGVILNALGGLVGTELIGVNLGGALVAVVAAGILVLVLELLRGTPEM